MFQDICYRGRLFVLVVEQAEQRLIRYDSGHGFACNVQ